MLGPRALREDNTLQLANQSAHLMSCPRPLEVSVEYCYFFTVNVAKRKNGTCTAVCLTEGVRLAWGALNIQV